MTDRMAVQDTTCEHPHPVTGREQAASAAASICLLGASFDTGNLGVSALAESSIKCILHKWPEATITLLASGREAGTHTLRMSGREVVVRKVPIRFCKNVFLSNHYGWLFLYAIVVRLLPFSWLKQRLAGRNTAFGVLMEADFFVDIAGGDSFSDIYGMRRFTLGFLTRLLPLMLKKDFVMFPQTYGPFSRLRSRLMARFILKRARRIYARDHAGLAFLRELLGSAIADQRAQFAPDVAFLLDPRPPEKLEVDGLEAVRTPDSVVVGLNISGLIYYGGYTGRNEFGLNVDYKDLIDQIIGLLLAKPQTLVLLVPHVIPAAGYKGNVENDLQACIDVFERHCPAHPGRLFVARGRYDQAQAKYLVGRCDLFIGTRMHSCIAALSQAIPAVGVAYSKKFKGVFETVAVEDLVADMRSESAETILALVDRALATRYETATRLAKAVPTVKQQLLGLLDGMDA